MERERESSLQTEHVARAIKIVLTSVGTLMCIVGKLNWHNFNQVFNYLLYFVLHMYQICMYVFEL